MRTEDLDALICFRLSSVYDAPIIDAINHTEGNTVSDRARLYTRKMGGIPAIPTQKHKPVLLDRRTYYGNRRYKGGDT